MGTGGDIKTDNPDDAKKLIESGVDFITSNILE